MTIQDSNQNSNPNSNTEKFQQTNHQEAGKFSRREMLKRTAFFGLSLALAACTPVATAPNAGATASASETVAPVATENKLIRLITSAGGVTLFAQYRGVFEESLKSQGIDVEWIPPVGAHAPALQAVTGGSADLTFGGSSTVAMASILGGSDFVFTALLSTQPRTTAILTLPDSGITKVEDLKGKKVAANRSGLGEFILIAALEKYGLTRDDIEIAYLNQPDAAPAFAQGQVDAWSVFGNLREIAQVEYGAVPIFVEGEELAPEDQIDVQSFIALRSAVDADPDVYRAVIDGYIAEAAWANENTEEALDLTAERADYSDEVKAIYATYKTQYDLSYITDESVEKLQRASEWLLAHEVLTEEITIADHVVRLEEAA